MSGRREKAKRQAARLAALKDDPVARARAAELFRASKAFRDEIGALLDEGREALGLTRARDNGGGRP